MLAVLEDAVSCFQRYIFGRNRRARTLYLYNETADWICDENTDYSFSFGAICAVFGLDRKYVREGLLRWKKSKLAQRQQQIVRIPLARSEELIRKLYSGGTSRTVLSGKDRGALRLRTSEEPKCWLLRPESVSVHAGLVFFRIIPVAPIRDKL